jgi:hypothetical protein
MSVVRFPPARACNPSIDRLRCVECSAPPMIFAVVDAPVGVLAFCGPQCAAGCGIKPWASTDLVNRAAWRDRAELEAGL